MFTFDRGAARKAGFSDEDIDKYLEAERAKGQKLNITNDVPRADATTATGDTSKGRGLLASVLPILGAVGGGIVGAPLGPAGIIAGGAAGGGFAEGLAQKISGEELDAKKIALNAAMGGVPFGRGASLVSKFIAPGAAVGGLGALTQDEVTPGGVVSGAVTGAGASVIGGPILSKVLKLGGQGTKATAKYLGDKSIRGGFPISPSIREAAKQSGVNLEGEIQEIIQEAGPKIPTGSNALNALTDTISGTGKNTVTTKGIFNQNIEEAEKIIDFVSKGAGKTLLIPKEVFVKSLKTAAKENAKRFGRLDLDKKSWNTILKDFEKNYPKGVTFKQALKLSRDANKQFGNNIFADIGDANIAFAQKTIAEAARNAIKTRSTVVADALAKQQKNIIARDALEKSVARQEAKGLNTGKVNVTAPGTVLDAITNAPRTATAVAQARGGQLPGQQMASSALQKVTGITGKVTDRITDKTATAGQVSALSTVLGGRGVETTEGTALNEAGVLPGDATTALAPQERSVNIQGNTITESQMKAAIMELTLAGQSKQAEALTDVYELAFPEDEGLDPLSVTGANTKSLASSGLRSLETAIAEYENDPSLLAKRLIPGQLLSRKFDSAMFGVLEALVRQRSGAAVPEQELVRYYEKLMPNFGDSEEVVKYKFNRLKTDLQDILKNVEETRGGTTLESLSGSAY